MKPALVLLALAACLTACSGGKASGVAGGGPSLQSAELRVSDVPSGFYLAGTAQPSPAQTARAQGLDATQYVRHGGEASLAEHFVLHHPATIGLTFIASQIIPFSSAADARWGFRQIRAALARSGTIGTIQVVANFSATPTPLPTNIKTIHHPVPPPPDQYQPEQVPVLGNEDAGYHNTSAAYAGEYVFDNQLVLFRRGRYCAVVHISGNYGQVPLSEALALAGKIERRLPKG